MQEIRSSNPPVVTGICDPNLEHDTIPAGNLARISTKVKNNNYTHHVAYLRNSIAYDHDFWYWAEMS